jgi:hypothetical protein
LPALSTQFDFGGDKNTTQSFLVSAVVIKDVASVKKPYAYSDEYQLMYDKLRKCRFKIDLTNPDFMFSLDLTKPKFDQYKQWDKLYKKIISI